MKTCQNKSANLIFSVLLATLSPNILFAAAGSSPNIAETLFNHSIMLLVLLVLISIGLITILVLLLVGEPKSPRSNTPQESALAKAVIKSITIFILVSCLVVPAFAQTTDVPEDLAKATPTTTEQALNLVAQLIYFLGGLNLVLLFSVFIALDYYLKRGGGAGVIKLIPFGLGSIFSWNKLVGVRPAIGSTEVIDSPLDHEYDGIVELDNSAPPLFNYILYGTIIFSVIYVLYYHVFNLGPFQETEYDIQMRLAAIERAERIKLAENSIDENNVEVKKTRATSHKGKKFL